MRTRLLYKVLIVKILEIDAKTILSKHSLAIPQGTVVTSPMEAFNAADSLSRPVVLKVQIPSSGRMKAGGVKFAQTPDEAKNEAAVLLQTTINNYSANNILLEEKLSVNSEIFLGITYDADSRTGVILGSVSGGIDVEKSDKIARAIFSPQLPPPDYIGRQIAIELGYESKDLLNLSRIITALVTCFIQSDALLLEVNPLILTSDHEWVIADVHMELDDDALFRQKELLKHVPYSNDLVLQTSDFEQLAKEIDSSDHRGVAGRLVAFDGNLGMLMGGGGASMTIFDAVLNAGLNPANYCEIGGNPSVKKVKELTKLILQQPSVDKLAVIMNVVSNTRTDLVARGVIKGIVELGLIPKDVISVFRIPGSWEKEGYDILDHYKVSYFGRETSIDEAVDSIKCRF
ncbi:MAG: hypothetical protein CMN79_05195 [Spirochaetales bacterium]|nr:hypothetical protein [Spirochaetales bacterium]